MRNIILSKKNDLFLGVLIATFSLFSFGSFAQTQTYSTAGTYSFIVPEGVTSVMVHVQGAGGGGGYDKGSGGGGGGYSTGTISGLIGGVSTLTVTVGTGGRAGILGTPNGGIGGFSSVSLTSPLTTVTAGGGGGGLIAQGAAGGGGSGTYSGGNGSIAASGGAGGGCAGSAANGFGITGGGGTYPGGNGGYSGTIGNYVGGGGGGGGNNSSGANGARGLVVITWTCPANAGTLSGTQTVCIGSTTTFSSNVIGGSWNSSNIVIATIDPSTGIITGQEAGSATINYTVTGTGGCTTRTATRSITVNAPPSAPNIGTITQPTCVTSTGSVVLNGLPTGNWTLTRNPGGIKTTGTGTSTTVSNLSTGTYTFTVTNGDITGLYPGSGTGLNAEYFNNMALTGTPALTRTDATVNFDWADGNPGSPIGNDNFSVKWTGKVQPQYSENYTFTTRSDDGIRLWLNGTQIINNWTNHASIDNNSTPISLISGQKYDIVLEFYENTGQAVAQLSWTSASQTLQIIPQTQLYFEATGCTSSASVNVVINAQPSTPSAPTGTAAQSFCSAASPTVTNLAATGTAIKWYAAATGGTALVTTTALVTGTTYYASQTISGCESASRFAVAVTVANPAAPTGAASQSFCSGASPTVASLTATATGILWYAASSGGSALAPSTPLVDGTHYFASQTGDGCESTSRFDVTATINPNLPTSVSIAASPSGAICEGTSVTFTATPTNGGTTPTYQWYNGASPISGATDATYNSTTLANGAEISVQMTSNATCATGSPATSSAITMTVYPTSVGGTVTASSSQVCYNTSTNITLAGSFGAIQWQQSADGINGWANVTGGSGATTASYITPNLITKTYYRAQTTSGTCSSSFSNTVEVGIDTEKPIISNHPVNISVPVTDELCSAVVNWIEPTASDNCTLTSFVSNLSPGATIAVGTSTVTYTATDNSGNVETFSFTITVTDNIKPTISCPAGSTVFCVANAPGYSTYAEYTTAGGSASDNCSLNTDSFIQLPDILSGSTLTRTYQIADMAGNTSTCSQVFTISQPVVIIGSLGLNNTCIDGVLDITSNSTGLNYQWQVSTDNGGLWTNIVGATSSSYNGNLVNQGDQYQLLVSETTDFSGVGCVTTSNALTFREGTPPVFINGTLGNQTVCTLNGAPSAVVYNISLTNSNVTDNCTVFANLVLAYSITGDLTESGTNLVEGRVLDLGTYNITYTVTDQAGKFSTHSSTIIVNQSPAAIAISHSVVSGGGTGIAPNQCGTYNYSVESSPAVGYTYDWIIYSGSGTSGAIVSNGYTLVNNNTPDQPASVQITWTGDLAPGTYTIEAIKKAGNDCESKATLVIDLQNSFDLQVEPAGQDCKAEVDPATEFTITWTVSKLCGSTSWGFTWYLFNQDLTELPANYTSANNGTGSFSEILDATKIFNTNNVNASVTNGNPYLQTVYTLFIVNTSDSNSANDYNKFYLKGIPETSEISTD